MLRLGYYNIHRPLRRARYVEIGVSRIQGAQISSSHHVLAQALQQRLSGTGRANAASAALNAKVLQHQMLQCVIDLSRAAPGLRTTSAPITPRIVIPSGFL